MLPDGTIEFLGRMDDQVKLRGYRIELQEIEKHLREVRGVKECVVTLYEKGGESELAAYYTSDETIDHATIKQHLGRFLPAYMVPPYFVRLETMPLSSNGKADKKLLPDPDGRPPEIAPRAPNDETEALIVRICEDVLKKDGIGMDDNFFDIGGHSLNAVRLISRIQKELNVDLALKEIFYHPVLADIAENVKSLVAGHAGAQTPPDVEAIVVPITDDELNLLSTLQFDDED
jgi:acyl carrier protein